MTELDKLENWLIENNIRYERIDEEGIWDRHQICVPTEKKDRDWDAICQRGSYGYEEGLLEIYGSLVNEEKDGDSVAGWLTAENVIQRFLDNEKSSISL